MQVLEHPVRGYLVGRHVGALQLFFLVLVFDHLLVQQWYLFREWLLFFATWSSGKKVLKGKSGNTELLELKVGS